MLLLFPLKGCIYELSQLFVLRLLGKSNWLDLLVSSQRTFEEWIEFRILRLFVDYVGMKGTNGRNFHLNRSSKLDRY